MMLRKRARQRLARALVLVLVIGLIPTLLMVVPGWVYRFESGGDRPAAEEAAPEAEGGERRQGELPLTDLAALQRPLVAREEDAPHLRLERLWESPAEGDSSPSRGGVGSEPGAGAGTSPGGGAEPSSRQLPPPAPAGTQTRVAPVLWPEPPNPFEAPAMVVDPRRVRDEEQKR